MLNRCEFIGNLGADPEIRTTQGGDKVANLRLAVSERWKDRNTGERREKTEWVTVTIWGQLAGIAEQYLRKGSKVYVAGKWQTRKWQDQSGQDRYSTECVLNGFDAKLVMLDGPSGDGQSSARDRMSDLNGFDAKLVMLDGPSGDGQSSARDRMSDANRAGYDAQAPGGGSAHFDDDIPFAACWWA